jgi:two-component system response regulator
MQGTPQARRMSIWLVEDNEDHALLCRRALRQVEPELGERLVVTTIADGAAALAALRGGARAAPDAAEAPGPVRELPDLVLLDLRLPGLSGMDVLRAMRGDADLRTIPVIVLTTSSRDEDVVEAYRAGANEYVTKPVQPAEFRTKVQSIARHWSQVVQRPPTRRAPGAAGGE